MYFLKFDWLKIVFLLCYAKKKEEKITFPQQRNVSTCFFVKTQIFACANGDSATNSPVEPSWSVTNSEVTIKK